MPSLRYAVIALKQKEVEQVITKIEGLKAALPPNEDTKALQLDDLAKWFKENGDAFYGKTNEEWKPFNGQTIDELINETAGYSRQTNLIEKFNLIDKNYTVVDPIRVYFIDVFALFLDKYNKLADKMDSQFAKQNQCCLIIPYRWPDNIQDVVLGTYAETMSLVYDAYLKGKLHRIAMRVEDLKNFRNYIVNTLGEEDRPSDAAEAQIKQRLPQKSTTLPGRENE